MVHVKVELPKQNHKVGVTLYVMNKITHEIA